MRRRLLGADVVAAEVGAGRVDLATVVEGLEDMAVVSMGGATALTVLACGISVLDETE